MALKRVRQSSKKGVAVVYARFSSHNQREVSIEQQVKECQKFAEANNLEISEIYADRAISGKTDQRANFQRMMKDAAKGEFQYVIAWKSSRMGRNMLEAMMNDDRLRAMGVRTLYTEEDFDDTAAGRFALRNMMNVNQFYSENMAEDIRRGMNDNAEKCKINGSIPLGYKKGEDGRYALDEPNAAIVKEIYERVADGEPLVDIYNDLNARGLKTSTGSNFNRSSFQIILHNERYCGVYIWGDSRVEGGIPRIISDALFHRVQEVLKTKKNAQGRHRDNGDYLLTGKLFCGHCHAMMVGVSGTSKTGAKHHYYVCQTKRLEKACHKKNVRREWIERSIAEYIKENVLQPNVIEWILDGYEAFIKESRQDSLLASYESELAEVNKALKNIVSAIEQGIFTDTTKNRLLDLENTKRQLEANISIEKAAQIDIPREQLRTWIFSFMEGNVTNKKYQEKLFDTFLRAVYLYDDSIKIILNYTGQEITTTLSIDDIDLAENNDSASVRIDSAQPHQWGAIRTQPTIYFLGKWVLLYVPL